MSNTFGSYFPAAVAGVLFILFTLQCDKTTLQPETRLGNKFYQQNCGGASILDFKPEFDMPLGTFFHMAFG